MSLLYIHVNEKNEKIQERVIKILYNDFDSGYLTLLNKHNKANMQVKRWRNLALGSFWNY